MFRGSSISCRKREVLSLCSMVMPPTADYSVSFEFYGKLNKAAECLMYSS
jgi:hypothetical protein